MRHTAALALAAVITVTAGSALADAHSGRARAWIVNPRGEVDGILLSDHTSVRFSTMTGQSIARRIRLGERIEVSEDGQTLFVPRLNWSSDLGLPGGGLSMRGGGPMSSLPPLTRTDRRSDGMVIENSVPTGMQRFTVRGRVAGLTYTRGRQLDGLLIEGGITVRVPMHNAASLGRLRVGDTVSVVGLGTRGSHGIGIQAESVRSGRGAAIYTQ